MSVKNKIFLITLITGIFTSTVSLSKPYPFHEYENLVFDTLKSRQYFIRADKLFNEGKYDSAIKYYKLAQELYNNTGNWQMNITCLIQEGNTYRKKLDKDNALKYLNLAENTALEHQKDNISLLSDLYYKKGLIYLQIQDNNHAIEYFNKTVVLRRKINIPEDELLLKTYNNIGGAYFSLGEYDLAIENYKKSLTIDKQFVNKTINSTINNIGSIYYIYGQYDAAIEYYRKAIIFNKKHNNLLNLYINYSNIGLAYYGQGQYFEALEYFSQAEYYFGKSDNKVIFSELLNNIGATYQALGKYNKALEYFSKSLVIAENSKNENSISSNYNNLGVVYDDLKDFDKALDYYNKALAINKTLGYKTISGDLNNIGTIYFKKNKYDIALNYYQNSLQIAQLSNNKIDINHSYRNLGHLYLTTKQFEKALNYYQKGINLIVPNFTDSDYYKNPKLTGSVSDLLLLQLLNDKADAFNQFYEKQSGDIKDLNSCLANYDLSINLIDKMRTGYTTSDTKLFFTEKEKSTYSKSIEVAMNLYDRTNKNCFKNSAFEYAEKGKVTLLYGLIREHEAGNYAGIPDSIIKTENSLKQKIAYYNKAIYEQKQNLQPDLEKLKLWENKIFSFSEELQKLTAWLEKKYPRYYEFKYDNKIFSPLDVQELLNKNDALLEYFIGENELYTFFISKDHFCIIRQKIDSTLIWLIDKMRHNINNPDLISDPQKRYIEYTSSAYSLYKILIKPFSGYIKGKHLIIIPDGALGYIPFEALITEPASKDRMEYKSLSFLIKYYSVSYAYSSTLLINSIKLKNKPARLNMAAFAPYFNKKIKPDKKLLSGIYDQWKEIEPLVLSKKEVIEIGKLTHGKVFLDRFATESEFKAIAGKYRILHVATHGLLDDNNPMYSKLVFYLNNDSSEDGYLNTYELFNMELHADLAVLSACNTGSGKLQQGEGIMTIARGFLYAGVPSIVMSLWSVNDESSTQIMESFYKYVMKHYTKDEALRHAKLDYLSSSDNTMANPYFWAGFVNIGNTKPIRFTHYNYLWLLMVIIPLAIFLFYYRRKRLSPFK